MRPIVLYIVLFTIISCEPDRNGLPAGSVEAYVPIYAQAVVAEQIAVEQPRTTIKAGKIYAFGSFIYQNEENKGIHIINNTDPSHPVKTAILKIPFNTDFAVRGTYVYANSLRDLVVINLQDPAHPVVEKRITDAFPLVNQQYPPFNGRFVCPDASKGIIVSWELKTVEQATCRR